MPAMSCSLFYVDTEMNLANIRSKLENYNTQVQEEVYGETYTLRTFISDVHWESEREVLSGILSYERLQRIPQVDGTATFVSIGRRVMFSFFEADGMTYLTSFSNRRRAETSANIIDHILTEGEEVPVTLIFNCRIPAPAIEQFLATHSHIKKTGGWKDLDFVGVNTSTLRGGDLDRHDGTRYYDEHGTKRYIMMEVHALKKTIRISERGIVTFYGNVTKQEILNFVRKEIIPLL